MTTTSVQQKSGFPFILRVIWFFLLGWELSLMWILIAWFLNLTIIGLPFGLWMLNRVPLVLTLRIQTTYDVVTTGPDGQVVIQQKNAKQHPFGLRAVYFALVGWWFSLLWALIAWVLCVSIIGLPFGVWMLNRLPGVTTLQRQ